MAKKISPGWGRQPRAPGVSFCSPRPLGPALSPVSAESRGEPHEAGARLPAEPHQVLPRPAQVGFSPVPTPSPRPVPLNPSGSTRQGPPPGSGRPSRTLLVRALLGTFLRHLFSGCSPCIRHSVLDAFAPARCPATHFLLRKLRLRFADITQLVSGVWTQTTLAPEKGEYCPPRCLVILGTPSPTLPASLFLIFLIPCLASRLSAFSKMAGRRLRACPPSSRSWQPPCMW